MGVSPPGDGVRGHQGECGDQLVLGEKPSWTLFSGPTSVFHTCSTLTEHLLYAKHCPGPWGLQNEEHPALSYGGQGSLLCSVDAYSHRFIQQIISLSTSTGHLEGGMELVGQ